MIQVKREPPKCRNCDKILMWKPWTGKPQPPVDPSTGEPCDCWKMSNGDKPRFLGKSLYVKCPYCETYYQKEKGNEEHERLYHLDKVSYKGSWITEEQRFTA